MNIINHPKSIIHFIHIGKTGGTCIKEALKENLNTKKHTIVLHNHSFKLSDVPPDEKVFFFLRDPVQRFVSAFYSRQRQGMPRYNNPWSPQEKDAFSTFLTPRHLAEALGTDDINYREKAISAMRNITHVKTSFFDWFKNEEYFKKRLNSILLIGFQDNLTNDFDLLKKLLDLPNDLKLPEDDIKSHRNAITVDRQLSALAQTNLANWYSRDIHFYNICKQNISTLLR